MIGWRASWREAPPVWAPVPRTFREGAAGPARLEAARPGLAGEGRGAPDDASEPAGAGVRAIRRVESVAAAVGRPTPVLRGCPVRARACPGPTPTSMVPADADVLPVGGCAPWVRTEAILPAVSRLGGVPPVDAGAVLGAAWEWICVDGSLAALRFGGASDPSSAGSLPVRSDRCVVGVRGRARLEGSCGMSVDAGNKGPAAATCSTPGALPAEVPLTVVDGKGRAGLG